MSEHDDARGLQALGNKVSGYKTPTEGRAGLEKITADIDCRGTIVRLTCPEFTSMCPVTGQPDFATIIVDYWPGWYLVESKSWKLYMHSFRNHGAFHERIAGELADALYYDINAAWVRVSALFLPRGGIPIDVFVTRGKTPNAYIPPIDTLQFRGR